VLNWPVADIAHFKDSLTYILT